MKEQCRTVERFLPEVLTASIKKLFDPVTKVMARATVHTEFSLLFVQNYLQSTEKDITVLSITAVFLLCYNYLSCTKLLEGGLLSEHV